MRFLLIILFSSSLISCLMTATQVLGDEAGIQGVQETHPYATGLSQAQEISCDKYFSQCLSQTPAVSKESSKSSGNSAWQWISNCHSRFHPYRSFNSDKGTVHFKLTPGFWKAEGFDWCACIGTQGDSRYCQKQACKALCLQQGFSSASFGGPLDTDPVGTLESGKCESWGGGKKGVRQAYSGFTHAHCFCEPCYDADPSTIPSEETLFGITYDGEKVDEDDDFIDDLE